MSLHNETAAPVERDGGEVDEKAVAADTYLPPAPDATDFGPIAIAAKSSIPFALLASFANSHKSAGGSDEGAPPIR